MRLTFSCSGLLFALEIGRRDDRRLGDLAANLAHGDVIERERRRGQDNGRVTLVAERDHADGLLRPVFDPAKCPTSLTRQNQLMRPNSRN